MSENDTATELKAIIIPPGKDGDRFGEGVYTLICEDGEVLASHFCSHEAFAPGDLFLNRPERQSMFDAKRITEFVWLEDSGLTLAELKERNAAFAPSSQESPNT